MPSEEFLNFFTDAGEIINSHDEVDDSDADADDESEDTADDDEEK